MDKTKVNILLVDDQPGKLLTYEATLQDLGENLVKANSAREAFDYLLRNDVAVVLIDVHMPDLDGYQLASMIRDHPRFEKTALIFISATYQSEFDRLRGYESGAVDYLPVPIVPEILRAKVKIFVELYRKTQELRELNQDLENRVDERTKELLASNERLRESEERLRLASEAAEFGTYDCNFKTGAIHCSDQMKRLLNWTAEGDLSIEGFLALVDEADRAAVSRAIFASGALGDQRHRVEYRVPTSDGGVRWLLDCGRAYFDGGAGEVPARVMGTVLDLTERKQVEERQLLLMAELDHRVKNILANVGAIAKLSSKRKTSVDEFVDAFDSRIQAVAKAHSLLRRDSWVGISLRTYVTELLAPFMSRQVDNIILEGEEMDLTPKAAQSLALVFHELATNAVKYGALSVTGGTVKVSWTRFLKDDGRLIRVRWEESGGPSPRLPTANGFGTTVIKAVAQELGAEFDYEFTSEGVVFCLDAAIEQTTKSAAAIRVDRPRLSNEEEEVEADGGLRILMVEDEVVVALHLRNELEKAGHKVIALATNLPQGIALADDAEFDVAFLDVRLGEDLSVQIADRLIARGIPFAFGTGFEDGAILPPHLQSIPKVLKPYKTEAVSRLLSKVAKKGPFENLPDNNATTEISTQFSAPRIYRR
jgi:PAS domain S-box-containing protein